MRVTYWMVSAVMLTVCAASVSHTGPGASCCKSGGMEAQQCVVLLEQDEERLLLEVQEQRERGLMKRNVRIHMDRLAVDAVRQGDLSMLRQAYRFGASLKQRVLCEGQLRSLLSIAVCEDLRARSLPVAACESEWPRRYPAIVYFLIEEGVDVGEIAQIERSGAYASEMWPILARALWRVRWQPIEPPTSFGGK